MLKISRAALFAATLGLAAPLLPALAQDTPGQPTEQAPFVFELKVPSVVAVDSSMSEDQIKDVFTSNFLDHADQLASLNATSITIPELSLTFNVEGPGGGASTITYRDIVLSSVQDGHADKLSVGSGESVSQGQTTTYGAITADNFDMKRLLEFTGIVKGDPNAPLKAIYSAGASTGSTQTGALYSCSFGGSNAGALEARPAKVPFADVMGVIETFKGASAPPPEALNTIVAYGVDLLRAFRGGGGTVGAIDCTVPADAPVTIKVAGATAARQRHAGSGQGFQPHRLHPRLHVLQRAHLAGRQPDAAARAGRGVHQQRWEGLGLQAAQRRDVPRRQAAHAR